MGLNFFSGFWKSFSKALSLNVGIVVFVFLATFCIILPIFCMDKVHSIYFSKSYYERYGYEIAQTKNEKRFAGARRYFQSVNRTVTKSVYKNKLKCDLIDILIYVVTVKRRKEATGNYGYLTQTMAALDYEIKKNKKFCGTALKICNTNHPAAKHDEARNLSDYFVSAVIPPYENANLPLNGRPKEQQDKLKCFRESLNLNFRYFLMVEDDAIPISNFLPILRRIIAENVEYSTSRGERINNTSKWAYLNLHFPEVWQGYSLEIQSICELISIGIIGGMLWLVFVKCLMKNVQGTWSVFTIGAIFCILLTFVTGRQYFFNLLTFWPWFYKAVPAPGCCTPATLYPRHQIPAIIEFVQKVKCHEKYGIDLALKDYCDEFGMKRYLTFPNMFHHIGMYSTLSTSTKKAEYFIS